MADRNDPIHIPEDSELAGTHQDNDPPGKPYQTKVGDEVYTLTIVDSPEDTRHPPDPERVSRSIEDTIASAGSWKGLVDAEELKAYIREQRRVPDRSSFGQ